MDNNSDEIDLIELLKTAWSGRKQIIIISFVFVLVGVAAALLSPVVYSSSTTFINSQTESSSSSGLSGVASLVGINLGGMSSGSEIPPTMYPQLGESIEWYGKIKREARGIYGKNKSIYKRGDSKSGWW